MKINKEWHLKNKMPKNPTLAEREKWHIGHAKNCNCREMSESIKREIENYAAGKAERKKESFK
jgi:hypothetical protein